RRARGAETGLSGPHLAPVPVVWLDWSTSTQRASKRRRAPLTWLELTPINSGTALGKGGSNSSQRKAALFSPPSARRRSRRWTWWATGRQGSSRCTSRERSSARMQSPRSAPGAKDPDRNRVLSDARQNRLPIISDDPQRHEPSDEQLDHLERRVRGVEHPEALHAGRRRVARHEVEAAAERDD